MSYKRQVYIINDSVSQPALLLTTHSKKIEENIDNAGASLGISIDGCRMPNKPLRISMNGCKIPFDPFFKEN